MSRIESEPQGSVRRGLGDVGFLRALAPTELANRYGLLLAWIAVIVVFSAIKPNVFFTASNFQTIFGSQAVLLIVTMGLILPLTAGEFDLSIAGVVSVSVVLVGWLNAVHHWPIAPTILAVLAVALAVALVNVFLILVVGVESIVVTLGMGTLLIGAGYGINQAFVGGISPGLVEASRHQLFGIQLVFYYGLALTAIVWYVFAHTPLGRYMYFVGVGRDVSRLAGIRVDWIRAGTLIMSSLLSAVGGIFLVGLQGSADPIVGGSYLLPAFSAAFLGATAVTPGRFNPWGSFIAVYFLVTGITGLQILGYSGWIEQVFYGGALVIAVALSKLAGGRRNLTE